MIETILYSVAFVALLAASINDIRTREVPDWVSYALIASALGLRLLFSIAKFDWSTLLSGIAGFLVFVAFGYLMYYTGQWGGGDSKLVMGMGAVIGLNFTLALFFINVLFAGALYGVVWIAALAWIHAAAVKKQLARNLPLRNVQYGMLFFTVLLIILSLAISNDAFIRFTFTLISFLPLLSFYLFLFIKSVEKVALYKQVHPKELTEGDWLAQDIVVNGKYIAGKKDLGVTKAQIKQLFSLYQKKRIKKIMVKNGIPFVPSFLIGFILTVILGNWVQALL